MANKDLQSLTFETLAGDTYMIPQVDDTLAVEGAAADAKKTGDEIEALKSGGVGLTADMKAALMACIDNVAWSGTSGKQYRDDLYEAIYNRTWQVQNVLYHCSTSNLNTEVDKGGSYTTTITPSSGYTLTGAVVTVTMGGTNITTTAYSNGVITIAAVTGTLVISVTAAVKNVTGIDAVFTQGTAVIYNTYSLDNLVGFLVVTATYDDTSTETLTPDVYELSGTLETGTSTITVTFETFTDTFTVTVTDIADVVPEGYVTDGLVFFLDGLLKEEGNTTWTDIVMQKTFTLENCTVSAKHGVTFTESSRAYIDGFITSDEANETIEFAVSKLGNNQCIFEQCKNGTNLGICAALGSSSGLTCWFNGTNGKLYRGGGGTSYVRESANRTTCVKNGTEITNTGSNSYSYTANDKTYIGSRHGVSMIYTGTIYTIRIYNRHLTVAEMQQNQAVDATRYSI